MIKDFSLNPLVNAQIQVNSEQSIEFTVLVDCALDYKMTATSTVLITVEGRKQGDTDWVDLQTDEIDLSDYDGTTQAFEIRVTADTITTHSFEQFTLRVSK